MRIYPLTTGVLKTADLPVTKPIGSLIIYTDCLPAEITNELITVYVERANGDNTELMTRVPLIDFMMISTYGESAITDREIEGTYFNSVALCELTPTGAIFLSDNERIKVVLEGLKSAKYYMIDGIEEPITTNEINKYERKSALAGESARKFNMSKYDSVCFSNPEHIQELVLEYDNGRTTRHSYAELLAFAVDTDPILYQKNGVNISQKQNATYHTGLVSVAVNAPDKLVFPLVGVREMEIIKTEAELIQFTCMGDDLATI